MKYIKLIFIMIFIFVFFFEFFGLRWNISASMPHFLYQVTKITTEKKINKNDIVFICTNDDEFQEIAFKRNYQRYSLRCSNWSTPLIKPVVALSGDLVEITNGHEIKVNGNILANSKILKKDGNGLPLPSINEPFSKSVVADGFVWVISGYHPKSWDSRYFGALSESNVLGIAEPIF